MTPSTVLVACLFLPCTIGLHRPLELDMAGLSNGKNNTISISPQVAPSTGTSDRHLAPRVDICYVHVGKCAGGTIAEKFRKLAARSPHSSYIEVHSAHRKELKMMSGPVKHEDFCLQRELTVIWVRDPVDRLISSWRWALAGYGGNSHNATDTPRTFIKSHPGIFPAGDGSWDDLDYVARRLALSGDEKLADKFLWSFHHGHHSLSWYVHEDCAMIDEMRNVFVGRVEYMKEDWEALLQRIQVPSDDKDMAYHHEHVHNTHVSNWRELSPAALSYLRGLPTVQADLKCMRKLAQKGLLSSKYVDAVSSSEHHALKIA